MRRALFDAALYARDLAGFAVTSQRETVVVWERATGAAVRRALVWQDRRTTVTCESLGRAEASGWVQARSGLRLDPYFWLRKSLGFSTTCPDSALAPGEEKFVRVPSTPGSCGGSAVGACTRLT